MSCRHEHCTECSTPTEVPEVNENYVNIFSWIKNVLSMLVKAIKLIVSFITNLKTIATYAFYGVLIAAPIYLFLQFMNWWTWKQRDKMAKKTNQDTKAMNGKMNAIMNMMNRSKPMPASLPPPPPRPLNIPPRAPGAGITARVS